MNKNYLNDRNAKAGTVIICTEHPEWEDFIITSEDNGRGWIEIRGMRGSRVLYSGEFCFWEKVMDPQDFSGLDQN